MMSSQNKTVAAEWLNMKLLNLQSGTSNNTVGVLVDKSDLDGLTFLGHLQQSQDFRKDLSLSKSYWYYHPETAKRFLLV